MSTVAQSKVTVLFWVFLFGTSMVALGLHDLKKQGIFKSTPLSQEEGRELMKALHGTSTIQELADKRRSESTSGSKKEEKGNSSGILKFLGQLVP